MDDFYSRASDRLPSADVRFHDSRYPFPLPKESISLMLTSPPYGDSRTTVAYGQFSRLALQWLDMWEKDVDKESLGGKPIARCCEIPILNNALDKVRLLDEQRAKEVEAFYQDLYLCMRNISTVVRPGGFAVFVVANRKVKGITLPTDKIIVDMMQSMGFSHVGTLQREIPNKRMPLRNSPSNIPGQTDVTMLRELIVLLRKQTT
jgi:tRNA G10  N-methylase Trm11